MKALKLLKWFPKDRLESYIKGLYLKFEISGEFGYELFKGLPLVNWYKEQGHDVEVISSKGSSILYPNIKVTEKYSNRHSF